MINKRQIGTSYEIMACDYLKRNGMQILERNFRCRQGEIDIICLDDKYLVFVEVKYRRTKSSGTGYDAVNIKKQRRISNVALYYMYKHHYNDSTPVRFDVISILDGHIHHLKNAFSYMGNS